MTGSWILGLLEHWLTTDDVFEPAFLGRLLLARHSAGAQAVLGADAAHVLDVWNSTANFAVCLSGSLPEGPYYLYQGTLYTVLKIFPDYQEAFVAATMPQSHSIHEWVR